MPSFPYFRFECLTGNAQLDGGAGLTPNHAFGFPQSGLEYFSFVLDKVGDQGSSRRNHPGLRLSDIYAALDCTSVIALPHLEAALAVWDYCYASAALLFSVCPPEISSPTVFAKPLMPPAAHCRSSKLCASFMATSRATVSTLPRNTRCSRRLGQA
jgi:hypothetical protein